MAKPVPSSFLVEDIKISDANNCYQIEVLAARSGRPNKRIVIKSHHLKIISAEIVSVQKNKTIEHTVTRINSLPTQNQIRIHTSGLLYPGKYHIKLTCPKTTLSAEHVNNFAQLLA